MPCAVAVASSPSPVFSPSPRVSSMFFIPPVSSPVSTPSHSSFLSSSPCSAPPLPHLTLQLHRPSLKDGLASCSSKPQLLKRKRPATINIPATSWSFPAVQTPADVDRMNVVEFEGEEYCVYCKRGKKGAMEDRYSAVVNLQGDSKQAFFGIFDGHGGAKAAEFAAKNLDKNIMKEVTRRCEEEIGQAVKDGYLTTDAEFLNKAAASGGTCCVTALIHKGALIVSNAGDCRAVLSRGGVAEALTVDHRPSRKDERDRVEKQGGYVDYCNGVWRIQGSLAVSRGLGDQHLKQWVVAEPETKILEIRPECEFLILASDGLWEKVGDQEAVDVVRPLCIDVDKPETFFACKKLVNLSRKRGSFDDISVMVIQLARFLP